MASCIWGESGATCISITAASLTSKFFGESEKTVEALFEVARLKQPSIIFIDEIGSILNVRKNMEDEAARKVKMEFCVQWQGLMTEANDEIIVIRATNRPFDLDEAARRTVNYFNR